MIKSEFLTHAEGRPLMRALRCAKSAHGSFRGGASNEGRANPGLSERVKLRK